ncbi:glycoside hydrolase [Aureobasidium pullulans]|uniref:chitinase n=1 Tax=Aureobasidium pullulans TaxID=5580 RepID=A0A4S9A3J0_AURPU|nr:glycoside hydrolase [Aureobasidium pullulans]
MRVSLSLLLFGVFALVSAHFNPSVELAKDSRSSLGLATRDLPTGTCNADTPCVNGACCGTNGLCGYSPTECGSGNCTSNCNAKAECGQYGVIGKQICPLGVCCSKFGFCGSTDEFCSTGCQTGFGGCGPVTRPSCKGGNSAAKRSVGYYESWSNTRKCQSVAPEDLNLNGFTHINFAFAFFDPTTFAIAPMDGKTGYLYSRFTALKSQGVQTWISVGGWSFTDPGPTRTAFSTMSSTSANRKAFISGLIDFMDTYGFDGVDIDWEYPQADDRGGASADTANYVALVKDMRTAFGTKYGITVTLPTSYWYLQHFDLTNMQASVDWFNVMSYDLHGVWDAESKNIGPYIAPHTNLTEIDLGLDLLWRAGIKPAKVVLGQGWYGRSFTLTDPTCKTPNGKCQFSGGADAGKCSNAAGILDLQEIKDIISDNNLTPTWDKTAGVKWINWASDQWVSYDDDDTFKQKADFANSRCLGGLMVWAMDQVDQTAGNQDSVTLDVTEDQQADAKQKAADLAAGISCYTTDCDAKCKSGTNQVEQMNGQPGSLSTNDRCSKGKYRSLCCDDGTTMGTCQWRGYRGVGLSCISGCDDGETEVVQDTNHKEKKKDQTCSGGLQSYCCKGFQPAPNGPDLAKDAKELASNAAEAIAAEVALDIAAKAFCRIAVPALLLPLELIEDAIPIVGEILDLIEIAATPAIIQACVKGIEKEGKAEFKVFGKKHTLSMDKPTKPVTSRPPTSTHSPAKTSSNCPRIPKRDLEKRALDKRAPACVNEKYVTVTTKISDEAGPKDKFVCTYAGGNKPGGQACLHYSSVIAAQGLAYDTFTCKYSATKATKRPGVAEYNVDRPTVRTIQKVPVTLGWFQDIGGNACERDEWPPAAFLIANDGYIGLEGAQARTGVDVQQFIRYLDKQENNFAGKGWVGICAKSPPVRLINTKEVKDKPDAKGTTTITRSVEAVFKRQTYSYSFEAMPNPMLPDWGLADNRCQPSKPNRDDRGFALLNRDPWFGGGVVANAVPQQADYKLQFSLVKRDVLDGLDALGINGTSEAPSYEEHDEEETQLSRDEMLEAFGIKQCKEKSCKEEAEALGLESLRIAYADTATLPAGIPAIATATGTVVGSETAATSADGTRETNGALSRSQATSSMPRVTHHPRHQAGHHHKGHRDGV